MLDLVRADPLLNLATMTPDGPDRLILTFDAETVIPTTSREAWGAFVDDLQRAIGRAMRAGLFSNVEIEPGLFTLRVICTRYPGTPASDPTAPALPENRL